MQGVRFLSSPHFNQRPDEDDISLIVIHNISLPAGQFGLPYITELFLGCLDCSADESFADLQGLEVSAHCLIRRDGSVIQYVPFNKRAWHAGVSEYKGRQGCNDFSIGIELEGSDHVPFTNAQYASLEELVKTLIKHYPRLNKDEVTGHSDIAPGRKTDPGPHFDWQRFRALLNQ
ncbi:N-acetyl-anhydromuranmyl-L-alanine amidase [Pseudoalteromonas piratica]|uniref:1,6-anhydro-N-acetylmuramyl-L-alanine amidase AmpD n=1 Tax=Pseudoalteromonas piratica TaxID=1348114 RepID=A0A0A7EIE0_9GAMM|nr:N-acetyl-anhydromuranmyl-L-alanine amidase [Pseudoalteromonas piratica]